MAKKNEELEFLEQYYKFYLKGNFTNNKEASMVSFIANAQATLVETSQISQTTLDNFQQMYYLQEELEKKEKQIEILKKEMNALRQQLSSNSGSSCLDDGCGRSSRSQRGGC